MNEQDSLSPVLIALFKGVVYREETPDLWQELRRRESRIRDYVSLLGLELMIHENEGFSFLKNREPDEDEEALPRLIPRHRLSYPVSLTLALLRRRMAEHDALGGEERLILDTDEVVELVRTFLPESSTEARIVDRIQSILKKTADLGYITFLDSRRDKLEVKRIITAFVDAQWLNEFDQRLAEYAAHAREEENE